MKRYGFFFNKNSIFYKIIFALEFSAVLIFLVFPPIFFNADVSQDFQPFILKRAMTEKVFFLSLLLYFFVKFIPSKSEYLKKDVLPNLKSLYFFLICIIFFAAINRVFLNLCDTKNDFKFEKISGIKNIFLIIFQLAVFSLYEEILYRKYLVNRISSLFVNFIYGKIYSVFLSAIFFSFAHFYLGFYSVIFAFLSALCFSLIYHKTGNILFSFSVHFFHNLVIFVLINFF